MDIVPTVLDLLGLRVPAHVQGRSPAQLMGLVDGEPVQPHTYYAESLSPRLSRGCGELRVLYRGPLNYIHGPRPELCNLADDPHELGDLAGEQESERQGFERALETFIREHATPNAGHATHELDEHTRRRLAALGYLGGTGDTPRAVSEKLRSDGAAPQDRVGDINLESRLRQELSAGRFHLAKQTALQLVGRAPDNSFYRAKLVDALLGLGQVEAAAQAVDATPTISAGNAGDFLRAAWALHEAEEHDRGQAMARRVIAVEETAEGHIMLGRMAADHGEHAAFECEMKRALELDPKLAQPRLELADRWLEAGDLDRAEQELRAVLERYPVHVRAHLGWASLLRAHARNEEAQERLERILKLAPGSCEAHLERIEVLLELKNLEAAEAALLDMQRQCRNLDFLATAEQLLEAR